MNRLILAIIETDDPHVYRQAESVEWDQGDEEGMPVIPNTMMVHTGDIQDLKRDSSMSEMFEAIREFRVGRADYVYFRYVGDAEKLRKTSMPFKMG